MTFVEGVAAVRRILGPGPVQDACRRVFVRSDGHQGRSPGCGFLRCLVPGTGLEAEVVAGLAA